MHSLVNRAIERFVTDVYGEDVWSEVTSMAAFGFETFEPLLTYDPTITDTAVKAASFELAKSRESFLEDLGHYLVTHPNSEAMRRLLRFGGATFLEFIDSLEDVPERARLALPGRHFPEIQVNDLGAGTFILAVGSDLDGLAYIVLGAIRGMADDYGALVTLEHRGYFRESERITISVHDAVFAEGRSFDLVNVGVL